MSFLMVWKLAGLYWSGGNQSKKQTLRGVSFMRRFGPLSNGSSNAGVVTQKVWCVDFSVQT
ncbi:MAG: hypothetical protein CMI33_02625 [Opitutales bacterium]|nr:hypothetical protein [Opitutales bacterium]